MAKNDTIAIDTLKTLILKLTHIAMMKARGLPQDHIDVVPMAEELIQLTLKFKGYMDDDAAPYLNLPDNVIPLSRPTAH